MKHKHFSSAVFIAAVLSFSSSHAGTIVKLSPHQNSAAALSLQSASSTPAGWRYLPALDFYVVDDRGRGLLDRLKKEGSVVATEEGNDVQLESLPDDPMLDVQGWVGEPAVDIEAPQAWNISTGSEGVIVAIVDTGIDTTHQDLQGNLWTNTREIPGNGIDDDGNGYVDDVHGYNFWDDDADVTDQNNHGSHLAGIIGAVGDNGVGISGVSWHVSLMPIRFTDANGNGTSERAIEAIDYAMQNGAKIINASWTLKLDSSSDSATKGSLLREAIKKAGEAGILFVTAAGNQLETDVGLNIDSSPVYPAAFDLDNILSVAALGAKGGLAAYSNYGPTSVDLAAPGTNIYSTLADGRYGMMSGTSIATAVVTGSAALTLSINPHLTPDQLKSVLEGSAIADDSLSGLVATGGRLDVYGALVAAQKNDFSYHPAQTSSQVAPSGQQPSFSQSAGAMGGCSLIPE